MSLSSEIEKKAAKIRLVIFDVDGVLTDGRIYISEHGTELKVFHVHDGLGIKRLRESGIEIAVISGRDSLQTKQRMNELGISHVYQGVSNKLAVYEKLLTEFNFTDDQIACVGDDLPDLELIKRAGLGIAVANATPVILENANWITKQSGGQGAAREISDFILTTQQNYL